MAEQQTNKERLKDITDSIERGIQDLFQSDKYAEYLRTMSRFHKYSVNNTMLIYMQKPDATHVAGFNKWRDQFERNVLKGEKGIKIIAPTPYKKKIEQEKLDPDTKMPMLDEDGKVIVEEKEIKIPLFKPVTVFDVSQTDGKPLPQLASDLSGNVQNYEVFMEALRRSSPVPIDFKPIRDDADGFFSLDNQSITIREGMSEIQTVSAVVHEIAHSKLHNKDEIGEKYQSIELFEKPALYVDGRIDRKDLPEGLYAYDLRGSDDDPGYPIALENHVLVNHAATVITAEPIELPEQGFLPLGEEGLNFTGDYETLMQYYHKAFPEKAKISRNTEEVQAESISFAVCAYYGIATGENSFGYIATWSKDKDLKELRASLETINKTSSELITDIDRHYGEIMKEREAEVTIDADDKPLDEMGILEMVDFFMEQGMTEEQANDLAEAEWQARKIRQSGSQLIENEQDNTTTDNEIEEITRSVQVEPPVQAPDNGYMPDPSMSIEAMNAYGYTDSDMLPLSKERALELFERDVPIYMLYDGNTEAMAFEAEDIVLFSGCFGITREDWDAIKNEVPPMDMELIRKKREQAFFESTGDTFAIYQLKNDESTAELTFVNSDYLKSKGIEPQYENYELVYTGALTHDGTQTEKLEGVYRTFNIDRPQDFMGHSLSVSDIVALKQAGVVSCHYVDSIGYKELPKFLEPSNYLKTAEMQMEDDYGMIDGIINNGPKETEKTVKRAEEAKSKKPSVLAKLRKYQDEDRQTTSQHRSAERDL